MICLGIPELWATATHGHYRSQSCPSELTVASHRHMRAACLLGTAKHASAPSQVQGLEAHAPALQAHVCLPQPSIPQMQITLPGAGAQTPCSRDAGTCMLPTAEQHNMNIILPGAEAQLSSPLKATSLYRIDPRNYLARCRGAQTMLQHPPILAAALHYQGASQGGPERPQPSQWGTLMQPPGLRQQLQLTCVSNDLRQGKRVLMSGREWRRASVLQALVWAVECLCRRAGQWAVSRQWCLSGPLQQRQINGPTLAGKAHDSRSMCSDPVPACTWYAQRSPLCEPHSSCTPEAPALSASKYRQVMRALHGSCPLAQGSGLSWPSAHVPNMFKSRSWKL